MKKVIAFSMSLILCLSMAGCGKTQPEQLEEDSSEVYCGILEEKKDFMIIVSDEDSKEEFIFNLKDGVKCEAEVNDKVEITYTGTIGDIDKSPVATKIEKID